MNTQTVRFMELALLTVAVCLLCGMASQNFRRDLEARSPDVEPLPKRLAASRGWSQLDLGCYFAGWTAEKHNQIDLDAAILHLERGYNTAGSERAKILCACGLAYLAHQQGDRTALEQQLSRLRLLDESLNQEQRQLIAQLQASRPGEPNPDLREAPSWLTVRARF